MGKAAAKVAFFFVLILDPRYLILDAGHSVSCINNQR